MTMGVAGIAAYGLIVVLLLLFRREVDSFLRDHEEIASAQSLEAFKTLARRNMKAVFPLVALFFVGAGLSAQWAMQHKLAGTAALLLVNGIVALMGVSLSKKEKRARALPCSDPLLAEEYQRIAKSWVSDPWPRF